jgi:hypothetical protein
MILRNLPPLSKLAIENEKKHDASPEGMAFHCITVISNQPCYHTASSIKRVAGGIHNSHYSIARADSVRGISTSITHSEVIYKIQLAFASVNRCVCHMIARLLM